jgi:hypothetical protein
LKEIFSIIGWVMSVGRGLIPAVVAVFLPVYVLFYSYSESTGDMNALVFMGIFFVVTWYEVSPSMGDGSSSTSFFFFDPNWYLDIEKYITDYNYSTDDSDSMVSEVMGTYYGVGGGYGNLKDVINGGEDWALGIPGYLMAAFILFLAIGIILNVSNQEKLAGYLFLIAGVVALIAMLITWDALTNLAPGGIAMSEGDWTPIPIGSVLVLIAGIRGVTTEQRRRRERY